MKRSRKSSRYGVPLLGLAMGVVFLVSAWIGGNPALGWIMLAIMVAYSAILLLAGRFDAIQVLRGTPADERYRSFETRATVVAANVTIVFVLTMAVIDIARGEGAGPYTAVACVFGATFLLAIGWLRWRG